MKVNEIQLLISAVAPEQFPAGDIPEIALAGRSNVGKSSLINKLISRKNFAYTSGQPGKTQTLNFYQANRVLNLVDVPGYGYARVSKKQRESFGKMYENYLTMRRQLRGVVILVDSRHDPTEDDISMYDYVSYYELPILIVATKIDKITRNHRDGQLQHIRKVMQLHSEEPVLPFSAVDGAGQKEIWDWIEHQMKQKPRLSFTD